MGKGTVGALHPPDAAARRPGQSKKTGTRFYPRPCRSTILRLF